MSERIVDRAELEKWAGRYTVNQLERAYRAYCRCNDDPETESAFCERILHIVDLPYVAEQLGCTRKEARP